MLHTKACDDARLPSLIPPCRPESIDIIRLLAADQESGIQIAGIDKMYLWQQIVTLKA